MSHRTLLLSGADLGALLPIEDCITAVEAAFRRQAEGAASPPAVLGIEVGPGGFHLKAAALRLSRPYFAAKLNGNFPDNPARHGLPTIQGVVALCDADDGRLLSLMDSIEITRLRTAAATAVAAKYLARPDSASLMLFGCGRQGRVHVEALRRVLPLRRVFLHDLLPAAAERLARWIETTLHLEARVPRGDAIVAHARECDVLVTCTPSRRYFLTRAQVRAGTFVAGVGADAAGKQELEPALLAAGTLVVDVLEQCASIGELHHALTAGVLRREDVYAELAEVVAGAKQGRRNLEEITIFDSTGTALEDVAAAALAYERAVSAGCGTPVCLAVEPELSGETI